MPSKTFLIAGLCVLATACIDDDDGSSAPAVPVQTADFSADAATAWFDLLIDSIDAENLNPPEASRRIGYAGVALYEAVVPGMPDHSSLGGQLNDLDAMPVPAAGDVHWPSAVNAALADVLANLFATASAPTLQAITDLEAALAAQYALDADPAQVTRGVDHGAAVAADVIAWAAEDGYTLWNDCAFTPPVGDGMWVPTPPAFVASPLEPCWGNLRPFVLLFAAECAPLSHPPYSLTPGSAFAMEAQEVYDVGNSLTQEQMDIATFWADGGGTLTPPGHWISIANQVIEQEGIDLAVAAEAYAKVGIAVADAFIACWEIKFTYNLMRPITYIQDLAGPIADGAWTSFIGTPPFPEFTSGHSTQSGAAAALLGDLLGDVTFTDHTHDGAGLTARTFDSFDDAAWEAALSRLYGGIHYRAAIERGVEQGECISRTILREVEFRR
jgi:hypothetical protein